MEDSSGDKYTGYAGIHIKHCAGFYSTIGHSLKLIPIRFISHKK